MNEILNEILNVNPAMWAWLAGTAGMVLQAIFARKEITSTWKRWIAIGIAGVATTVFMVFTAYPASVKIFADMALWTLGSAQLAFTVLSTVKVDGQPLTALLYWDRGNLDPSHD